MILLFTRAYSSTYILNIHSNSYEEKHYVVSIYPYGEFMGYWAFFFLEYTKYSAAQSLTDSMITYKNANTHCHLINEFTELQWSSC